MGNEKEEHFDDEGNKVGETRFDTNIWGQPVQTHYDSEGRTTGTTKSGTDWLGNDRAEHFNTEGERVGTSKNEQDWLGNDVQRHYSSSREKVGETRRREDWLGNPYKDHKGEYFKAQETSESISGRASSGNDSSYSAYDASYSPSRGSTSGSTGIVVLFVVLAIVVAIVVAALQLPPQITLAPNHQMSLLEAKQMIPKELKGLYRALDAGDPRSLTGHIAPQLLSQMMLLDQICKPYSYRGHYIESIVERGDGIFEARVHALFQPVDEQEDIFQFAAPNGAVILQDVRHLPQDWIDQQRKQAIDVAREFIYAARAGKQETVKQLISLHLDVSPLFEQGDYANRLADVNSIAEMGAGVTQNDGIKIALNVTTGRRKFCGDLWHLVIDPTRSTYRVVEWEFVPIFGCYTTLGPPNQEKHIDPDLAEYTLRRFGIRAKPPQPESTTPGG
jgi:hypothetical protein